MKAARDGHTGVMVVFERESDVPYRCRMSLCSIYEIANAVRLVPADWILPYGEGMTEEFLRYARPLADMDEDEEGLPALS